MPSPQYSISRYTKIQGAPPGSRPPRVLPYPLMDT